MDLRGKSLDPVELFTRYHIIGLRHTKNGYIRAVKHVQFGWMTPQTYYALQKAHDVLPIAEKVIEGGYRLKAALWSFSAQVPYAGISVPIGLLIPVSGLWGAFQAWSWADQLDAGIFPWSAPEPSFSSEEERRSKFHAVADTYRRVALMNVLAILLPFGDVYLLGRLVYDAMTIAGTIAPAPPPPAPVEMGPAPAEQAGFPPPGPGGPGVAPR